MVTVVIVNAQGDSVELRSRMEHPGLQALAAVLQKNGFEAEIFDSNFLQMSTKDTAREICDRSPAIVGFTTYYTNTSSSLRIAAELRRVGFTGHITMGGHHATFNAVEILKDHPEIDSVIRGEGEGALLDLTRRTVEGHQWQSTPNVAHAQRNEIVANPCRPLIADLDRLPFPQRKAYEKYLRRYRKATMISSRGCFGQCSFCSIKAFYALSDGSRWRGRSPKHVVDEIETIVRDYGIERISFMDDEFLGPGARGRERAIGIAEELLRRGLSISFSIECRPDSVNEDVLRVLMRAGLDCVDVGLESWIPRQLNLYGKQTNLEQNRAALATLDRLNLNYRLYVMPVDPYVTVEELLLHIAEMERMGLEHFFGGPLLEKLVVFKGTPLEERFRTEGILTCPTQTGSLGPMEYRFEDPEVSETAPYLHRISSAFGRLRRGIRTLYEDSAPDKEEELFGTRLMLELDRECLEILREYLLSSNRRAIWDEIEEKIDVLRETVEAVGDARRRGAFKRFESLEFRIGRGLVRFPSEAIRDAVQDLWAIISPDEEGKQAPAKAGDGTMSEDREIQKLRTQIDKVDCDLLALLNSRERLVLRILARKRELGMEVFAPDRESGIIARLREANEGPLPGDAIEDIYRRILYHSVATLARMLKP